MRDLITYDRIIDRQLVMYLTELKCDILKGKDEDSLRLIDERIKNIEKQLIKEGRI